jgi:hypothetical protein
MADHIWPVMAISGLVDVITLKWESSLPISSIFANPASVRFPGQHLDVHAT